MSQTPTGGRTRQQHGPRHLVAGGGVGVGGVEPVTEQGEPLVGLDVEHARGDRRRVLARAVADHRVDPSDDPAQHGVDGRVGAQD